MALIITVLPTAPLAAVKLQLVTIYVCAGTTNNMILVCWQATVAKT
jgi:hypothetical protein